MPPSEDDTLGETVIELQPERPLPQPVGEDACPGKRNCCVNALGERGIPRDANGDGKREVDKLWDAEYPLPTDPKREDLATWIASLFISTISGFTAITPDDVTGKGEGAGEGVGEVDAVLIRESFDASTSSILSVKLFSVFVLEVFTPCIQSEDEPVGIAGSRSGSWECPNDGIGKLGVQERVDVAVAAIVLNAVDAGVKSG